MIGLDTNVLLRYIVRDDASQAKLADKFIETRLSRENAGFIAHIVLCELVWVLESGYGYERELIATTLQRILETDRLRPETPGMAWQALAAYRKGMDFADALIGLTGQAAGCDYTISFDHRAARFEQFRLLTA